MVKVILVEVEEAVSVKYDIFYFAFSHLEQQKYHNIYT